MNGMAWNGEPSTIAAIAVLFDDLWSARRAWLSAEEDTEEEDEACALVEELEKTVSALPADSPAAILVKLLLVAEINEIFSCIEWGATALDYAAAVEQTRNSDAQMLGRLLRDLESQVAGTALADVLAKHRVIGRRQREEDLKDADTAAAKARIEGHRARETTAGDKQQPTLEQPKESPEEIRKEMAAIMELTVRIVKAEKPEGYGPDERKASGDHFENAMERADAALQARRYLTAGRFSDEDRPKVEEALAEFERRFGPIEGPPPPLANAVREGRRPRLQHPSSW